MVRHASAIEAFCRCYLDHHSAQDAAQETFVRVLQRCHAMKRSMPFKPWLYAIARNVCISMLRRQRVRAAIPIEAVTLTADLPDEDLQQHQRREVALAEVNRLPRAYRDVMIMHFLLDFTCEETAAALGLKAGTVRVRLHRAIARIRESLTRAGMLP